MKRLLLVTNGFPYGNSERGFLTTEYHFLSQKFEVYILAIASEQALEQDSGITPPPARLYSRPAYPPLKLSAVFRQLFRRDVRKELQDVVKSAGLFAWRCWKSVLCYSARAEAIESQMSKICEENKIDLIYTYWCTQATLAALRIGTPRGIPVVTRFHGVDLYNERADHGRQVFRSKIAAECAMLVFAAERGKSYFNDRWGHKEKSVVSILGASRQEPISWQDDGILHLVSCSNMIPLKRIELIIEALSLLPNDLTVSWMHVGDGEQMEQLKRKAAEKLTRENIRFSFIGAIPNDEIRSAYQREHVQLFITTSSTEGNPVSIQEAFSMGIPAIGTDVGGIGEMIRNGYNGFLLPANPSAQNIAQKILDYNALPYGEKRRFSANARETWADRFSAENNADKFVQMLIEVLEEKVYTRDLFRRD